MSSRSLSEVIVSKDKKRSCFVDMHNCVVVVDLITHKPLLQEQLLFEIPASPNSDWLL